MPADIEQAQKHTHFTPGESLGMFFNMLFIWPSASLCPRPPNRPLNCSFTKMLIIHLEWWILMRIKKERSNTQQQERCRGGAVNEKEWPHVKIKISLWLGGSAFGVPSHTTEGCGFHPWSGHTPRLWVWSPVRACMEATNRCFSLWCFSLCLPSSLSKINKNISLGEDLKKIRTSSVTVCGDKQI